MWYKIGDLAKTIGMPVNAIRFYEKFGIVDPVRSEGNFRSYGEMDLYHLLFAKYFRSMGFSLEQTAALLASSKRTEQFSALEQRAREMRQELLLLQKTLSCIENELKDMNYSDALLDKCEITELPGMFWLFSHTEKRDFHNEAPDTRLTEKIMALLPQVRFMSLISTDQLEHDRPLKYSWGLAFDQSHSGSFTEDELAECVYLPPCSYIVSSHLLDERGIISTPLFARQLADCKASGYKLGATALASLQFGVFMGSGRTQSPIICYLPIIKA